MKLSRIILALPVIWGCAVVAAYGAETGIALKAAEIKANPYDFGLLEESRWRTLRNQIGVL